MNTIKNNLSCRFPPSPMDPMFFFTNWKARESVLGFDGFLSEEVCVFFTWNFLKKQRIFCRAFFEARGWRELKHFKSWGLRLLLQICSSTIFLGGDVTRGCFKSSWRIEGDTFKFAMNSWGCLFSNLGVSRVSRIECCILIEVHYWMSVRVFFRVNDVVVEGSLPQIFLPKMPSLKTHLSHLTIDGWKRDLASFFWGKTPLNMGESHCQF